MCVDVYKCIYTLWVKSAILILANIQCYSIYDVIISMLIKLMRCKKKIDFFYRKPKCIL